MKFFFPLPAALFVQAGFLCAGISGAEDKAKILDPFSGDGVCAFADHIEAEGDVAAAASELARCIFLKESSDGRLHPELRDRRVKALIRAGELEQAQREMQAWTLRDSAGAATETALSLGRGLIRANRDSLALTVLSRIPDSAEAGSTLPMRARLLEGAAWLRLGAVDSTRARIAAASRAGGRRADSYAALLQGLAGEYDKGIGGSKWAAGFLSACVPGLGKAYAGRKMDAIATLITIAFFGWQAYDGYDHDGPASIKGSICAAAGTGLYLGNIYGSVRAIDVENARRRSAFAERVRFVAEFQLP